jgi:hypothetical protein
MIFFVSRPHPQHAVVIRKISSAEDDHLETVLSTSNGINTNNRHEVLRRPSVGMVPISVRIWLQSPQRWLQNYNYATNWVRRCLVLHFTSHGQIATVVAKYEHIHDVDQNNVERVSLNQYQLDYQRHSGLTVCRRIRCDCTSNHMISTRPYCAQCAFYVNLTTRFTILKYNNAEKCVIQSNSDVYLEN